MALFRKPTERERLAARRALVPTQSGIGLPALAGHTAQLYGQALPRGVRLARPQGERAATNAWMSIPEAMQFRYRYGDLLLGTLAGQPIGYLDDRPMVTIGGARSGKSSTILEVQTYLYPGSMVILDPKGELASKTARLRAAMRHDVYVLDPFGQSGCRTAHFNALDEIDPSSDFIIDDVDSITQAIVVEDGDSRSRHWNDSARTLLRGLILFVLTLPKSERNLVTVRKLLTLNHPLLLSAVQGAAGNSEKPKTDAFFVENRAAVETLFLAMAQQGEAFDGILAAVGKRFAMTPPIERGSIMSTAAAATDLFDSLPVRRISEASDFQLASLAAHRPMTIYLVLPASRMQSHFRWLRLVVQQACTVLERLGPYPRDRLPILFMMEEFATLGHMDLMERAAAYLPGFGVKLWMVLQDLTQLQRNYQSGWETLLGNAGLVQCFANSDQPTVEYLSRRLEKLIRPFELRQAFSRESHAQVLLVEGKAPLAAVRLTHDEVAGIRARTQAATERLALPKAAP